MLQSLSIKNYAIIENVEMILFPGLNIITGETGAGKSILIGALHLILGKRADTKVLFDQTKKCIVEGIFDVSTYKLKTLIESFDLEYDEELIIRREINAKGKSRAFINDTPVTLQILSNIASRLIDLHQQFDTLDIHSSDSQTDFIDSFAGNETLQKKYTKQFVEYSNAKQKLQLETKNIEEGRKELDFITFQMNELVALELVDGEQETIETDLSKLENAEEIQTVLTEVSNRLEHSDINLIDELGGLKRKVMTLAGYDPEIEKLVDRMESNVEDLKDITAELTNICGDIEFNPLALEEKKQRIDTIYRLQKKHNVNSVSELLAIQNSLETRFATYSNSESYLKELQKVVDKNFAQAKQIATKITETRKKVIPTLEKKVKAFLKNLAMSDALLKIELTPLEMLAENGCDQLDFLFTANKGSKLQGLKNVASGGELSRLNLSLKASVADKINLPSLVFDEIDTGVSGEVAHRMGKILEDLSKAHQVIVITHSPQVAAKAKNHFFVYKETKGKNTHTHIKVLDEETKIIEIAKMLSGNPPSDSAIMNAKELIGQ